jgi:hypothetical protein
MFQEKQSKISPDYLFQKHDIKVLGGKGEERERERVRIEIYTSTSYSSRGNSK